MQSAWLNGILALGRYAVLVLRLELVAAFVRALAVVHANLLEHLFEERLQQEYVNEHSTATDSRFIRTHFRLATVEVELLERPVLALFEVVEHQVLQLILQSTSSKMHDQSPYIVVGN